MGRRARTVQVLALARDVVRAALAPTHALRMVACEYTVMRTMASKARSVTKRVRDVS